MIGAIVMTALRELVAIRKSSAAFSTMVLAVLVYAAFYPQPYLNEAVREVPTVVVDQDNSNTSRELIRRIDAGEGARVTARAQDMPEARALFFAREVSAIVIIPPDFERDLLAGRRSPIAAYGDGGYFLMYRQALSAIGGAAKSIGAETIAHRLIAGGTDPKLAAAMADPMPVTMIPLFNPQGGYASYVVPAAFVLILQQTLLMGVVILGAGRPRQQGSAGEIATSLLGRACGYLILYSLWILLYLVILPHLYDLPRIGSALDTILLALPFLLSVSFLGLFIGQMIPNREIGILLLVVLGMPLFFLAGVAWPAETIPWIIHYASELFPSSSAIRAMVQVNQMGATLADVRSEIITLWGLAGFYALLAFAAEKLRPSLGAIRRPVPPAPAE